jgi:transcriptional regulator of heat shock response
MVRRVDFDLRRNEILRKTIEYYLETAQPVSSEALLDNYKLDYSSATIRNVLNDLEKKGFLTHMHTSAGRIPTDLGYRFYINDLMNKIELSGNEKDTLDRFFNAYMEVGNDMLENTSRILSNFTHYVGIMNQEGNNRIYYCGWSYLLEQPEFKDIDTIRSIFKALEQDRLLDLMNMQMNDSTEVFIGEECKFPEMQNCSLVIHECKGPRKKIGKLAVLGPRRMAYGRVISMMDYLSDLIVREFD